MQHFNKFLTDVVASVLSKYQTIFLVQLMFTICEIIIEKNIFIDAVPHRDIDLAMKTSKIINNLKLVEFKTFLIVVFDSLGENAFINQFLGVGKL